MQRISRTGYAIDGTPAMGARVASLLLCLLCLVGCRIELRAPSGGVVLTESSGATCDTLTGCAVKVSDTGFNETFVAIPDQDFQFIGWKADYWWLCGGSLSPCTIDTSWYGLYPELMDLLASDLVGYIEPVFIPHDHIRSYEPGDEVIFSGTVETLIKGESAEKLPVSVREEYLPRDVSYQDKNVLTVRTTITYPDSEAKVSERSVWQEGNGALFELTDHYGNAYVTAATSEYGLLSIPVPLLASYSDSNDFYTMYGGPVTGPVTYGVRSNTVLMREAIEVPMGSFQAYPLLQKEKYEYYFTYVEHSSGSTVDIERDIWVSPAKGIIKKNEIRREYSRSGVLQSEVRWQLVAEAMNF